MRRIKPSLLYFLIPALLGYGFAYALVDPVGKVGNTFPAATRVLTSLLSGTVAKVNGGFAQDVSTGLTSGNICRVSAGAITIGAMQTGDLVAHASTHLAGGSDPLLAAPGTIGGTTPGAATFTTVQANTSVSPTALAGTYNIGGTPTVTSSIAISPDASLNFGDTTHRLLNINTVNINSGASALALDSNLASGTQAFTSTTLQTYASGSLWAFKNNATTKAAINFDGNYVGPGAGTDTSNLHGFPSGTGHFVTSDNEVATITVVQSSAGTWATNNYIGPVDASGTNATPTNIPGLVIPRTGEIRSCYVQATGATSGTTTITLYMATGNTNTPTYNALTQQIVVANGNKFGSDTTHLIAVNAGNLLLARTDTSWTFGGLTLTCSLTAL